MSIIFSPVYLELILISVHNLSSLILFIPKGHLCTHGKIHTHEINHLFSVGKCMGNCHFLLVDVCNDILPKGE